MAVPDKRPFPKMPGGATPSVAPSAVRTFAQRLGVTEEEALKVMAEILGGPVEVVEPTEPFIVVVTDFRVVETSRKVKCSLCEAECWAAEEYGPLATYLCMTCAQNSA